MGIKHFEELPAKLIHQLLQENSWRASEKLDGSSITFGINQRGEFYSKRKTAPTVYRSVDDWPQLAWCNSFRSAHAALEITLLAALEQQLVPRDCEFEAEIIYGGMPNSIPYDATSMANSIVITRYLRENVGNMLDQTVTVAEWAIRSKDGRTLQTQLDVRNWHVFVQSSGSIHPKDAWPTASLMQFLEQPEMFGASAMEVIDCQLNSRPQFVPADQWNASIRTRLKHTREYLREELRERCQEFIRNLLIRHLSGDSEGLVVQQGHMVFKLVQRRNFSKLNDFTHRVRYYLLGGRRPPRSSFMSRTASWSTEARLARLDVLLARYIAHKHRFVRCTAKGTAVSYKGELHERTIVLFAELRERIQHGR